MKVAFGKVLVVFLVVVMSMPVEARVAGDVSRGELDDAIRAAASFLMENVREPGIGTMGGDWAVLGLARSGLELPDGFIDTYLRNVASVLRQRGGVLDNRRTTEYSRVVLGLTAAGADPRDVAGFDLLQPLADLERTVAQGANGVIFSLLALDSAGHNVPQAITAATQATREALVEAILEHQMADGGFSLLALEEPGARSTVDITAMALQALAKYNNQREVRTAINRGIGFLSRNQNSDGGFSNGAMSDSNLESSVQVLVAMGELGIRMDDRRFVEGGNSVLGSVMSFQNDDGGFRHSNQRPQTNLMSTEQALYGMVAVQRLLDGESSLYRMD